MNFSADIVIPVWNRPVETRASLASLVEYSPDARIIMVNNGSERETERILEEFAEALDERAILVSPERNVGRVAALNRGLELARAPVVIILQEGINVTAGWLEPILGMFAERPDAGLVVPLPGKAGKGSHPPVSLMELDHGSFGFMAIRRELFSVSGGFDEQMADGIWSLRDYSRRGEKFGYRTIGCQISCAYRAESRLLGSAHRREERIRADELSYFRRWGAEENCCLIFSGSEADFQEQAVLDTLLKAARQGCRITCIVNHKLHKRLQRNNTVRSHQNLSFIGLPIFFSGRALSDRIRKIVQSDPGTLIVNAGDLDAAVSGSTLEDFNRILEERHSRYYL